MKSGIFLKWSVGLALSALPLVGGYVQADTNLPPNQTSAALNVGANAAAAGPSASADESQPPEVVTAPAKPVEAEKALPPNIQPSGPAAEIIRLANSGVDAGVMLAYVTNSPSTFNLGADEIIYLNDLGVPGTVVTAMIQRDEVLKATNLAAATSPPPAGPPTAAPETPAPNPAELAPPAAPEGNYATAPLTPLPGAEASYSSFYGDLAPYGTWVNVDGYGLCWQPSAVVLNPGWQPYFDNGHWVYTDLGWYWLSDYSWGWAPFHYGRWFRHYRLGWCWEPDITWGPAWVSWRYSDDYCGWAPLAPGCLFTVGIGVTFHGHHFRGHEDWCGPRNYHFVAWHDFHDRQFRGHALGGREAERVFNRTTHADRVVVHNRTVINQGLPAERVTAVTHREVRQVALHDVNTARPGLGRAERFDPERRTLTVYHPKTPSPSRSSGTVSGTTFSRETPSRERVNSPNVRSEQNRDNASAPSHSVTGNTLGRPAVRPAPVVREQRTSSPTVSAPLVPQRGSAVSRQNQATPWANPVAQNEPTRPSWGQAQPTPRQDIARPNVSQNRSAAPAPAPRQYIAPAQSEPRYQAPVRSYQPPAEVPRYSPPAYAPAPRSYSPPPASRPSSSEGPRYSAPAAPAPRSYSAPPAAPSRAPDSGSRSAPPPSSGGGGNRNQR